MNEKKQKKIAEKYISTSGPATSRRVPPVPDEDDDALDSQESKVAKQSKAKSKSIFAQRMAEKAARKKVSSSANDKGLQVDARLGTAKVADNETEELNALMRSQGVINMEQTMSSDDILKMREQFLNSVGEETRQLLLARMAKKGKSDVPKPMQPKEAVGCGTAAKFEDQVGQKSPSNDNESPGVKLDQSNYGQLPINLQAVKGFPHMDTLEADKLGWTMENKNQQMNSSSPSDIQARFDMNGNIIDQRSASERTWLQGLHHHGEEMDKPGYTFEELMIYARSSVVSQRAFALMAIAAIFKNSHEGVYDSVLSINPLDILSNVDVVCALRRSLDFEDKVTLDAALSCISSVLYPATEEECYDVAYLFPDSKPMLWHKVPSVELSFSKDPTIRDHQILTADLIMFLIGRTNLLERIEYLLVDRPDRLAESGAVSAIQILIRIARHSPSVLLQHQRLLTNVCKLLTCNWAIISAVPVRSSSSRSDATNFNPVAVKSLLILKLLRILVQSSAANARVTHTQYNPMECVVTYLAGHSQYTSECCCHAKLLLLESFRFWSSSLEVGLGISEFSVIFPTLVLNLRYFCEPDALKGVAGFDGYYLAQVFNFLHCLLLCGEKGYGTIRNRENAWNLVKDLEYFVVTITMQVLQILATTREDWTLVLASKGLQFLTTAFEWGKLEHRRLSVLDHVKQLDLNRVAFSLQKHSVILNISKIRSRYPANFVSSSAVLTSSSVNPIIAKQSPFQFYKPWIKFLHSLNCRNLIFNADIRKYLELLGQAYPVDYFETFYIRFEQLLIFELLTLMDIEDTNVCIPMLLVSTLSTSDFSLFTGLLKLIASKTDFETAQKTDIVRLYLNCYFPEIDAGSIDVDIIAQVTAEEDLEKPILFGPVGKPLVKGKFWVLEPLSKLASRYSNNRRDLKKYLEAVNQEVETCLSFLNFLLRETSMFSTVEDGIESYVYVTQIFSMGEEVFLDPRIEVLLKKILQELVKRFDKIDLAKQPKPFTDFRATTAQLTSFKDFYRDLIKEFESLSYCSNIFSSYLMLPLVPTESREIKLLFWSMQGLQFVRIGVKNDLIPADYFTKEVETDRALLQLYTLLLVKTNSISRNNNELLFYVLDYHVTRGLPVEDMQKVMKIPW